MPHVPRHYGKTMFQRRCRDLKIRTVMPEFRAELSPATRRCEVKRQNSITVSGKDLIQPCGKSMCKVRIVVALERNAAFDLANADDAEEQVSIPLPAKPCLDATAAPALIEGRKNTGIDQ